MSVTVEYQYRGIWLESAQGANEFPVDVHVPRASSILHTLRARSMVRNPGYYRRLVARGVPVRVRATIVEAGWYTSPRDERIVQLLYNTP